MTSGTKEWLDIQRPWVQEAAHRLLSKGKIDDADIKDFTALIKAPPAVATGTESPAPRTYPSIGGGPATTDELRLVSIGNITGVDNLAPRIPLTFGKGNLTVIFGFNGSGKSGYTRILKRASGKAGAAELRPNVYKPVPDQRQCTITCSLNGKETVHPWVINSNPIPDLGSVDIFDSANGRVYLEKETEASYKPAELALFSDLVDVCKKVDAALEAEQTALAKALPELPLKFQTSKVALLYKSLSATTTPAQIDSQFTWKEEDANELKKLTEKLKESDPAAAAIKQRAIKQEIDALKRALEKALSAVTPESCQRIRELAAASKKARTAAEEGAEAMSTSSKLEGIGSETWRAMWAAACEYSVIEAYQGRPYPNVNVKEGARCVLCQQALEADAAQRLSTFEDYVSGVLESAAKTAESLIVQALNDLPVIPTDKEIDTTCRAADLSEGVSKKLKSAWLEVREIVDALHTSPLNDNIKGLAAEERPLIADLEALSVSAAERATNYENDKKEFDRKQAETTVLELDAKLWTSEQISSINTEVTRQKTVQQYEEWRKDTTTTWISRRAGELSEELITTAYIDRFNAELEKLGADDIRVELVQTRVALGDVKHRVQLRGVVTKGVTAGEILSEGEHRIVSLAAFLADVTAKPANVPFVFDDPISSLDHEFEWNVATRLVELAQTRQVIIFTHRLSLYGAVEDAAGKVEGNWEDEHHVQLCIESFTGTSGHPVEQSIWNSSTKTANNILITRLQDAKKAWDTGNSPLYSVHAQALCSDFRKLLERTIENDLLSGIVLRHRRSVQTEHKLPHLAKINEADCAYLDNLMTRYSCFEHSQSSETPVKLPDEPDLRKDVEGLKAWRDEFKLRG